MPESDSIVAKAPITIRAKLFVAVATSLLFFVGYGGAAYLTELRAETVGTWYYEWERIIPFVPVMIVPYMSIDLFFFASPFLCRDRKELKILFCRLTAVVVIASLCFLIYPLKLAVERPHAVGMFGGIYNWFTSMDRPYNLCPSMHIALRTVLAVHYRKFCRGWLLGLMHLWFALIGLSTLLLYQHHVIDVVGGFVLAVVVIYSFDGLPWRLPKVGGSKFAILYALASATMIAPVFFVPKLGWLLIWPAVSAAMIAFGYAWAGPAIYRRRNGKLTWACRVLLGPMLAAQWLSWRYYARRSAAYDQVVDGVSMGRRLSESEARELVGTEVQAVVDACNAFDAPETLLNGQRLRLPILDLTAPTNNQYRVASDFIDQHHDRGVYVHCKAGYSRSAALVAGWLLSSGRADSVDAAIAVVKAARPSVVIRPEIPASLQRWQAALQDEQSDGKHL